MMGRSVANFWGEFFIDRRRSMASRRAIKNPPKKFATKPPSYMCVMWCTFEQSKDFRQLTFSILLRNCCQSPPGMSDLSSSNTFNTYHKLFNKFWCVCELKRIWQRIKYCNHSSPGTVPAFLKQLEIQLTLALSMLQAAEDRFHSIPKVCKETG